MKKGFIFSFDSFLALIIFTLFTILIYFFFVFSSPTTQQYYFAEDILNVLSTVRINELNLNNYDIISSMISDGKIVDTSLTLFEQILDFQIQGKNQEACDLYRDITDKVLPTGYETNIDLTEESICGENPTGGNLISRNRILIGSHQA